MKWSNAVLANEHSANYFEAYQWKGLVESWIREDERGPIAENDLKGQAEWLGRHFKALHRIDLELARIEPCGRIADESLQTADRDDNGTARWPVGYWPPPLVDRRPRCEPTDLERAANLYVAMRDDRAAIDCYALAVSQSWSHHRFSSLAAEGHAARARAHERLGEWHRAVDHAVKSIASGGWGEPCLRRVEASWAEGIAVDAREPQYDPERLEQVARLFASAQLYPRAIAAAEHAGRLRGTPDRALLAQLWGDYLEMLETCREEYGGMAVVRGTPLTNTSINHAREQAERWSKR